MTRFRLLAVDIDGTLVNSDDEISLRTRQALATAGDSGVQVVLVTGRRYRRALPIGRQLGLTVPLVTAAGALIKRPSDHETLFVARFTDDILSRTVRAVAQAGYDPVLYGDTFHLGFDFYVPRLAAAKEELAEFFALNAASARELPDLVDSPPADVFAVFTMGTRDEMLALLNLLEGILPGELSMHVLRSPRYTGFMCEIAPAGITKWTGVLHLADAWGIAPPEICAVGDDVNDIPMLREAGLGVAMGNALPEVVEAADRVTRRHDEDGLVEVVGWLLGGA